MSVPSVTIMGNNNLQVGSIARVHCNTTPPILNSTIMWKLGINGSNNELTLNPVTLSDNYKVFTCIVSSMLLSMDLTKEINVTVVGKSY